MRARNGFSAIELMVVVAVIGIITAAAVPRLLGAINQYRVRSAVDLLSGELSVAKLQATSHSIPYQLVLGAVLPDCSLPTGGYSAPLPGTQQMAVSLCSMTPGSSPRAFVQAANTSAAALPVNIAFGFGPANVSAGDSGEQASSITQSTAITFNSLGLPVDTNGAPTQNNAIYIVNTSTQQVGAVTVSMSGRIMGWLWDGAHWTQR